MKCRCLFLILLFSLTGMPGFAQTMPEPADLLEYEDPRFLALSPDGNRVLLQTRRAVVDSNDYVTTYWLVPADGGEPEKLDLPEGAGDLEWFPDSRRIAYLAPSAQGRQVWAKEAGTDSALQLTDRPGGIRDFSLSPDGRRIAYTSVVRGDRPREEDEGSSRPGVEVDQAHFYSDRVLTGRLDSGGMSRPQVMMWITDMMNGASFKVSDTLSVERFRWSPSGDRIALSGKPVSLLERAPRTFRSDLYLFNAVSRSLKTLFKGNYGGREQTEPRISYSSPFWSPSGNRLGFVRKDYSDVWSAVGEVGIMELGSGEHRYLTSAEELELNASRFSWHHEEKIHVAFTHRVRRGLYTLSVPEGRLETVYNPVEHATGFSFDRRARKAVWVEESMGRPPEIYASDMTFESPRRITELNDRYEDIWMPEVRYVRWTSDDGTEVNGWLLEARGADGSPAPLLTHVHGGPGAPAINTLHPNRSKKYPLQIFAARGYSVFVSNYRGTNSFGKEFQEPEAIDGEPVEDIVSGIEHLISTGIADGERLGIMGHSHGGWLAPMVAAEYPRFRAASFNEGFANFLSLYGQMPGWLNLVAHEGEMATGTPYENPERYLELSPAFRENLTKNIPSLLEFGEEKGAMQGLEFGKAFWRHETPYKLVIYPDTGHNIFEPRMDVASMERNLQWFDRWITETN